MIHLLMLFLLCSAIDFANGAVVVTCFVSGYIVDEHFSIPKDFEQNREYGPLSGTCYEERAISAYNLGLLKPVDQASTVEICSSCASLGHKRVECPELV